MANHQANEPKRIDYPEGPNLKQQLAQRQRRGVIWRTVFMFSTLVGIIALTALLYNVIDSAFGYVAVQNEIDPEILVLGVEKNRMLSSDNMLASEDDEALATEVMDNPNGIGFFGYAYYQAHADDLKLIEVEGIAASPETVNDGTYPLARPLFIYTTADIMAEKPAVAEFVDYYLSNAKTGAEAVGYFPTEDDVLATNQTNYTEALVDAESAAGADDSVTITGSSTVYPLTQYMADGFAGTGFEGQISVDSIGTGGGFALFCSKKGATDISNASRPIQRTELDLCQKAKRVPLAFRVGTDALAIVVNNENDFLESVTVDELQQIFTSADTWSDVNAAWPDTSIARFIPGGDSGTLDFFAEEVFDRSLADLPKETLMTILEEHLSSGLIRRYDREIPFTERTQENVYDLAVERVVEPTIIQAWSLTDSFFNLKEIEETVAGIPNATMTFRSWLTSDFLVSPQNPRPELAGIRTAVFGSLWVILITLLFSLPVGVGAAIYLEEYAQSNRRLTWLNRMIETNINNLAGVPSIIYGMLGLAIFVRFMEPLTSGVLFGGVSDPTTANGRTVISAGLTLGLLILPIIIINSREAVRAVPNSLRQASYGLGATRWQTVWNHVLPSAIPGILTGNILAMSRAIGETAPLVVIGASTFIVVDPSGPFSKFTTLPIQIYQWTARPQAEFRNIAAAAIIVLLILLLTLNASAVFMRNRYSQRA
ncbi:MAG: phosphate ABC transporter permease PstA [Chloroflexota bacterium]